jgi:hypothetical protein
MRIVIRDRDTGMFMKMPNEWVVDVKEATDFCEMVKALHVALEIADRPLELRMMFGDGREDLRYPVFKERKQ